MTDEGRFLLPDRTEVVLGLPPAGDVLGDQIRRGTYEVAPAHRLVLDLVGPGALLVDAGAHIGTLSAAAGARGATVVAVEPNPVNAALLRANTAPYDVTVVEAVLGQTAGTVSFLADGAWGRVVDDKAEGAVTRPVVTGRELLGTLGRPPDVVKLDVEGYEVEALEGLAPLLTGHPPMVFECNAYALALRGLRVEQLTRAVEELGYEVFRIDPPDRLSPAGTATFQTRSWIDCLAVAGPLPDHASRVVTARPGVEDIAADVAVQARDPDAPTRAWLAGALAGAPTDVRADQRVEGALRALSVDRDRRVRRAAKRTLRSG